MAMVSARAPADHERGDCATAMSTQTDRLFLLLDPQTRRVIDLCTGPSPSGDCPSFVGGQPLPCEGYRVVPMRRTSANGLPFLVAHSEGTRCPLAWVDEGSSAAVDAEAPATEPDPEGWVPPEEAGGPAPGSAGVLL